MNSLQKRCLLVPVSESYGDFCNWVLTVFTVKSIQSWVFRFNIRMNPDLWRLVKLHRNLGMTHLLQPFWEYVNKVCERISETPTRKSSDNSLASSLPQNYSCSNPTAFTLWLLKHLSKLYTVDNKLVSWYFLRWTENSVQWHDELFAIDIQYDVCRCLLFVLSLQPSKSNYPLLESCIKSSVSSEVPESKMRVYLHLVENILNIGWELRTEPLILLWEYFHKRLNSSFFVPGAPISGLAIIRWDISINLTDTKSWLASWFNN